MEFPNRETWNSDSLGRINASAEQPRRRLATLMAYEKQPEGVPVDKCRVFRNRISQLFAEVGELAPAERYARESFDYAR